MKSLIHFWLFLALALLPVQGQGILSLAGSPPSASLTIHHQNATAETGDTNFGNGDTGYYRGQGDYNPGANISIAQVDFVLTKVAGDISAKTYVCVIYTQDGSDTLTTLHGTSVGVPGNNAWADSTVSFAFSPPVSVADGGNYAICVTTLSATDASNYASLSRSANDAISGGNFGFRSDLSYGTFDNTDYRMTIWK